MRVAPGMTPTMTNNKSDEQIMIMVPRQTSGGAAIWGYASIARQRALYDPALDLSFLV
jgi:hypothetical protein